MTAIWDATFSRVFNFNVGAGRKQFSVIQTMKVEQLLPILKQMVSNIRTNHFSLEDSQRFDTQCEQQKKFFNMTDIIIWDVNTSTAEKHTNFNLNFDKIDTALKCFCALLFVDLCQPFVFQRPNPEYFDVIDMHAASLKV